MTAATKLTEDERYALGEKLHGAADALAAAWHAYADVLLADLDSDRGGVEAGYGLAADAQSHAHAVFRPVHTACQNRPERVRWAGLFGVPGEPHNAILSAGIVTLADLQARLDTGTLEEVPGVGPATVRAATKGMEWAQGRGFMGVRPMIGGDA